MSSTLSDELLARAAQLSAASLHEAAGKSGALPSALKPLAASMRVSGRALPVVCRRGDNLGLHHAIVSACKGDVIVADVGRGEEFGYWGEVMATAAQARGVAGLVLTGGVRDCLRLIEMGFPVFATSVCIRGTTKDPSAPGGVTPACRVGDIVVARGDLVVGDADGVVVLTSARAAEIVERAEQREAEELRILERVRQGETTIGIYDLPDPSGRDPSSPRRVSVEVEGLAHGSLPIPAGSRVGPIIATGGVRGVDRRTSVMPEGLADQARNMFANLRAIIEAAGAECDDIVKVTVWIAAPEARAAVNVEWEAMFPDPHSRPARHILHYRLPAGMLMQCEALALAPTDEPGRGSP